MQIATIIRELEQWAPPALQENYDNTGLITGNPMWNCNGVLVALDVTEKVMDEAIQNKCNLVIVHHPIIFKGLKQLTGKTYVERVVIQAIKNDIGIYAIHTNLDNVLHGVNKAIADRLGLQNCQTILPKAAQLKKIYTFVPTEHAEKIRSALFEAGAGNIGKYSEASFNSEGFGTFKAGTGASPFVGTIGETHAEKELRVEAIFPAHLEQQIEKVLIQAHPYEEVAYDIVTIDNKVPSIGSGIIGELGVAHSEVGFLNFLLKQFNPGVIRHSLFTGKPIQKVAVCGGAGSFLTSKVIQLGADAFVTADIKYHEFFDADGQLLFADIGHWESEQFTIGLIHDFLKEKFPTFAVLKTDVNTNPVGYFR